MAYLINNEQKLEITKGTSDAKFQVHTSDFCPEYNFGVVFVGTIVL